MVLSIGDSDTFQLNAVCGSVATASHCSKTETLSSNHCCSGKAITTTYSDRVSAALGIRHAMRMRCIIILSLCGLSGFQYFSHHLINGMIFGGKKGEIL